MKQLKTIETAMPMVMAGEFIPEVCKTLESRRNFMQKLQPTSRLLKPMRGMVPQLARLYTAGDTQNRKWFYAIDVINNDMVYLMHLNPLRLSLKHLKDVPNSLSRFAMYQGSVWRARGTEDILGNDLPSDIFWKLFSQNRNWFSDSIQSEDGKAFWSRRINEAIARGHFVYAVQFSENNNILIESLKLINGTHDWSKYWTYEIHKDERGMNWRFAIVHK